MPRAEPDDTNPIIRLKSANMELIIDAVVGDRPQILYWGSRLRIAKPQELKLLSVRQWAYGGPSVDIAPSLSNELGSGVPGPPGFIAHRNGADWAAIFRVSEIKSVTDTSVAIICDDTNTQLRAQYDIALSPHSQVVTSTTSITNLGDAPVIIDWCSAVCLPLEKDLTKLMGFTGRWAMEFQTEEISLFRGSYLRENKSGRTSHDNFPGLIAMTEFTSETSGTAVGVHLGWSGNNRVRADRHSDGRSFVQMGELFFPGEMELAGGQTYTTPVLYAARSDEGLNHLSQQFHAHHGKIVSDGRINRKPRPVHYNTWEAVYFDHSEERLLALAEKAAWIGAERFVLDDGWFGSRRNDMSGLGDWWVSKDVYPNGLKPLVNKVRELGMEFGIWFEPEMVNPDSDLFRAHPDWILEVRSVQQVPFRDQYTLDLTRAEVSQYLYEKITTIVAENNVSYIKWDMNREIHHPASAGRAVIHQQTNAVYALMKRLRDAHPQLEIETCASGGGRADYGVLRYADRIWLSDSNDALDRQQIQRGASYFFPLNILGSHVGPRVCHITRRELSMEFRAATAIFGHMGLELNLFEESDEDLEILRHAVELHKKHRDLIHAGDFVRLDASDYLNTVGVVAGDRQEALISCAKTGGHNMILPGRIRLTGLDENKRYRVRIIWPTTSFSVTSPSIVEAVDLLGDGREFSGEALLVHGFQLPLMYPESCIVLHLAAV
ncbi:MAG: alpha-galactosidase [Marinicaulis sp.]|nr:alpha-galactosidase [Marinicaulis sp.]